MQEYLGSICASRLCFQVGLPALLYLMVTGQMRKCKRFSKCDVRRCTLDYEHRTCRFYNLSLSLGLDRMSVGSAGCTFQGGWMEGSMGLLDAVRSRRQVSHDSNQGSPSRALATVDFTSRVLNIRTLQVSRLSRIQVSADYSSGSCESDFVVVVTSNRQRAVSSRAEWIVMRREISNYGTLGSHISCFLFVIIITR